jgi:hypothetical protein
MAQRSVILQIIHGLNFLYSDEDNNPTLSFDDDDKNEQTTLQ